MCDGSKIRTGARREPTSNVHLVLMAGGSGTRFWPKSTSRRPKQLLSFGRSATLLTQTLRRFDGLVAAENRMIVTTGSLRPAIEQEAQDVVVLGEPAGRNTAPCVYWASRVVHARDPHAVVLVMAADHYVADLTRFRGVVDDAIAWATSHDDLVTLGVTPSRAETGYGYLQAGRSLGGMCRRVDAFVEKPDRARAEQFIASGDYFWNSGMFVWRVDVILDAFDRHMPEMRRAWDAAEDDAARAYPNLPATSIDFGVMEKASNVVMFPLDCGWEDVGSWASLENLVGELGQGHPAGCVFGGEVVGLESNRNIVDAPGKLVALLGVDDLIVAEHENAILVAHKARAQDVRRVVDEVRQLHAHLT